MSTTTIRLPDDLKDRVSAAAKRAGTTTHGFILEAIAEKTTQAECRDEFTAEAEARYERIVATGRAIPWSEMRRYLEDRISGNEVELPRSRKLGR
jgi:predicted transcriptional regulator